MNVCSFKKSSSPEDGLAPRTVEQNQALRDASRERLLAAAMRLFSRHGYSATSVRSIAGEAGVAQGLLYSHFRGKEELLKALFRRSMDDVRESFVAVGEPGGDPRSRLERLVSASLAILRRNLEFWRLAYGVRMQEEVVAALGPYLKAWTGEILAALEAIFRPSHPADAAVQAALFFAAFDGLCQHFVLDPGQYPLEAVSRSLLERFAPAGRPRPRPAQPPAPRPPQAPVPSPPPLPRKGDTHGKRRRR